jgi:hypothetical protein
LIEGQLLIVLTNHRASKAQDDFEVCIFFFLLVLFLKGKQRSTVDKETLAKWYVYLLLAFGFIWRRVEITF